MILYGLTALLMLSFLLLWIKPWADPTSAPLFWFFSAATLLLLFLFILPYPWKSDQSIVSRRSIIAAVDVSASMNVDYNNIARMVTNSFPSHHVEVIPFAETVPGTTNAEESHIQNSIQNIFKIITKRYKESSISAMLVLSDGKDTESPAKLKNIPTTGHSYPVHSLLKTSKGSKRIDRSVQIIHAPRFAAVGKRVKIRIAVSVTGKTESSLPVQIMVNGKFAGIRQIDVKDQYGEAEFEITLHKKGQTLIEASIAHDSREDSRKNNRDFAVMEGVFKGYRVLHLAGYPSANTAFVRRGLQNISGVDLISFFILRTQSQLHTSSQSDLSLIHFPTDELFTKELDNFDIIIINDFRMDLYLQPAYIQNIIQYVRRGGSIIFFGGPDSFIEKNQLYSPLSLEAILPVHSYSFSSYSEKKFSPKVTLSGQLGPLSMLENFAKPLEGINRNEAKPESDIFFTSESNEPYIVGKKSEGGYVLAVLSDSLWQYEYQGNISPSLLMRALIRQAMQTSDYPVNIFQNQVFFHDRQHLMDQPTAHIQFKNLENRMIRSFELMPGRSAGLPDEAGALEVKIVNRERVLQNYSLYFFPIVKEREFRDQPAGIQFMENLAKNNHGEFHHWNKEEDLPTLLTALEVREPIFTEKKYPKVQPLYEDARFLLLLLYFLLAGFYLKSRFSLFGRQRDEGDDN